MLVRDHPRCAAMKWRLYRSARERGISYHEVKEMIAELWQYGSSGDLTLEEYQSLRTIIRTLPKLPPEQWLMETPEQYQARRRAAREATT